MATPITRSSSEASTRMPVLAQKLGEQLVSNVEQGQQLSIDAIQTWVNVVSVIPRLHVPWLPGIPALPRMDAATRYAFDVAADLLGAQREYALQLTNALAPGKTT